MKKYILPTIVAIAGLSGSVGWAEKVPIRGKAADKIIIYGKIVMKNINKSNSALLVVYEDKLYFCAANAVVTKCSVHK